MTSSALSATTSNADFPERSLLPMGSVGQT